jgi:sulfite reductase (NADPH) flavoprotein alpha-component
MSSAGLLTRLDLAFSRDQQEKIYVQTRMRENGKALYAWLEEGGHFYVCGDATRMARDVDHALHDIIAVHGGHSADAATTYVNELKRQKRYVRDVY